MIHFIFLILLFFKLFKLDSAYNRISQSKENGTIEITKIKEFFPTLSAYCLRKYPSNKEITLNFLHQFLQLEPSINLVTIPIFFQLSQENNFFGTIDVIKHIFRYIDQNPNPIFVYCNPFTIFQKITFDNCIIKNFNYIPIKNQTECTIKISENLRKSIIKDSAWESEKRLTARKHILNELLKTKNNLCYKKAHDGFYFFSDDNEIAQALETDNSRYLIQVTIDDHIRFYDNDSEQKIIQKRASSRNDLSHNDQVLSINELSISFPGFNIINAYIINNYLYVEKTNEPRYFKTEDHSYYRDKHSQIAIRNILHHINVYDLETIKNHLVITKENDPFLYSITYNDPNYTYEVNSPPITIIGVHQGNLYLKTWNNKFIKITRTIFFDNRLSKNIVLIPSLSPNFKNDQQAKKQALNSNQTINPDPDIDPKKTEQIVVQPFQSEILQPKIAITQDTKNNQNAVDQPQDKFEKQEQQMSEKNLSSSISNNPSPSPSPLKKLFLIAKRFFASNKPLLLIMTVSLCLLSFHPLLQLLKRF